MMFIFHSIEAAVATFAQARPPGIYKGDYLKELFRRYGDIEEAPPPPLLPDWCFEDDEDEDEDEDGKKESEPGSSASFGKRRKERLKLVMFKNTIIVFTFSSTASLRLMQMDVNYVCLARFVRLFHSGYFQRLLIAMDLCLFYKKSFSYINSSCFCFLGKPKNS